MCVDVLTAFEHLVDARWSSTVVHVLVRARVEDRARRDLSSVVCALVHRLLQDILGPAHHVVGVVSVASPSKYGVSPCGEMFVEAKSYGSPMAHTKGCLPFCQPLLKAVVSQ